MNHVTAVTYPDGKADTYAYSSCCPRMVDRVTGRDGVTTAFEYDGLKRLISRADPLGVTRFGYDPNGNLTTLTDPAKQVTTFAHNLDDQLIAKTYQDGSATQWAYDAKGLRQFTNARGATAAYAYDANGNPTGINYSDATPDVTLGYDAYDRLISMRDGIGAWSYGYDADSELTSVDGPWENDTLTYAYDALGRRIGLTPQIGTALTYLHDRLSRLTQVRIGAAADAPAYVYAYAGANPLVQSLTRPNGSVTTYQYDALARLREIKTTTSGGAILSRHQLSYNSAGDRSEETITGSAMLPIPTLTPKTSQESVNAVNQLTGRAAPQQAFAYDADGNLLAGYRKDGTPFSAAYDAENRLISLKHTDSAGTTWTARYAHSGDGLLATVTGLENSRVISETRIVRDGGLDMQDRNGSNIISREYAWGLNFGGGIGGLLHMRSGTREYSYVYDASGNVEAALDSAQQAVAAYRYDPFGNLLAQRGTFTQPFRFMTKRTDTGAGLVYFGYRFYAPELGRWTSRDPLGEAGGVNLYAYVGNNPVNWVDPWGEIAIADDVAIIGIGTLTGMAIGYLSTPEGQQMAHDLGEAMIGPFVRFPDNVANVAGQIVNAIKPAEDDNTCPMPYFPPEETWHDSTQQPDNPYKDKRPSDFCVEVGMLCHSKLPWKVRWKYCAAYYTLCVGRGVGKLFDF